MVNWTYRNNFHWNQNTSLKVAFFLNFNTLSETTRLVCRRHFRVHFHQWHWLIERVSDQCAQTCRGHSQRDFRPRWVWVPFYTMTSTYWISKLVFCCLFCLSNYIRYNEFSLDQNHPLSKPVTNKVNTIKTIAQEIHCYKTAEFFIGSLILSWVFLINMEAWLAPCPALSNLITSRWNAQTFRTMSPWWSQMSWPQIRTMPPWRLSFDNKVTETIIRTIHIA